MMIKRIVLPLAFSLVTVNSAFALTDDQGTVTFTGNLINPPCQIETNSKNATVAFGNVASTGFNGTDAGAVYRETRPLTLSLTGCPDNVKVGLSFAGESAGNSSQLMAKNNNADNGLAITLKNNGKLVTFDDAHIVEHELTAGSGGALAFNYETSLITTKAMSATTPGDFTASATYTIYYP